MLNASISFLNTQCNIPSNQFLCLVDPADRLALLRADTTMVAPKQFLKASLIMTPLRFVSIKAEKASSSYHHYTGYIAKEGEAFNITCNGTVSSPVVKITRNWATSNNTELVLNEPNRLVGSCTNVSNR